MDREDGLPKSTRRKIIIGGVLTGAAAVIGGNQLLKEPQKKPNPEQPKEEPVTPTPNEQKDSDTPNETTGVVEVDNTPIDQEKAQYLTQLYSEKMDSESFPTDGSKKEFFEKVTQISYRLNKKNKNLASQLVSVMDFETKGTFTLPLQNQDNGEVGLFQITPENCRDLNLEVTDIIGMSASEQLTVIEKLLQKRLDEGGNIYYASLSDIYIAKKYPELIKEEAITAIDISSEDKEALLSVIKDPDEREVYRKMPWTKGLIDELLFIQSKEKGEMVENLMDTSRRNHVIGDLRVEDEANNAETEADLETATYLLGIYEKSMKDSFYDDESHALSQERKLLFFKELTRVAARLNPENANLANQIAAAMYYEAEGSFSSYKMNEGTYATGLIQFMPSTAHDMGTSVVRLAQLTPIEQLYYVEAFLKDKGDLWDISDVYMAIFYPAAVGKNLDYVIGDQNGTDIQQAIWEQNQSLDPDKTGVITKRSASEQVRETAIQNGENPDYITYPLNYSPAA